ncbi:tRNA threonylcarbamoyladenosine dehydratase [Eubacteriales bacterium OttesenSCG-928-G02]|nr:tRNA threonylcarbamoyladenosine dehydratase [Eubacteriales bacterium OttesenSCG-928-G02]
MDWLNRTEILIGKQALEKIKKSKVMLCGLGGVGSYAAEALARSGIGELTIIDSDNYSLTNLNRQLYATQTTINFLKTDVTEARLQSINPQIKINKINVFLTKDNISELDFTDVNYVIDAIDTVTAKLTLIEYCHKNKIPIISAMGAGNKLKADKFEVSDIYKTSVCPLAKVVRTECKKRDIKSLKVVYSQEIPKIPAETAEDSGKRQTPGSMSYVPSVAGLILAGEVIQDLIADYL